MNLLKILSIFFVLVIYFGVTGSTSLYDYERKLLRHDKQQLIFIVLHLLLLSTVIYSLVLSQNSNFGSVLGYSILLGLLLGLTEHQNYFLIGTDSALYNKILQILNMCGGIIVSSELVYLLS